MSDFESQSSKLALAIENLKLAIVDEFCNLFKPVFQPMVNRVTDFLEYVTNEEPTEKQKREFISEQDTEIIDRLRAIEYKHPVQIDELLKAAELMGELSSHGFRYEDLEKRFLSELDESPNEKKRGEFKTEQSTPDYVTEFYTGRPRGL